MVSGKTSVWGTTFTPNWNTPDSVTYDGKTYTTTSTDTNLKLSYTFAVIASDVGGIAVGETTNFNTATGQIKNTENAGTITVRITRAKVGDLPQATKEVDITITKKPAPGITGTVSGKTSVWGTTFTPTWNNRQIL